MDRDSGGGTHLKREAGLLQIVAYGVGNIIGAGIYVLVGDGAGLAGGALWLAFLIGAVVALFTGLSYAELSSMYPRDASEYVYMKKANGGKFWSFLVQWMMLATEIVAAAAVSLGFADYFQSILPSPSILVAAVLLSTLSIISMKGVKYALRLNIILSSIAIVGLLIVIVTGAPHIGTTALLSAPNGFEGITGAAILVFFAFIGFDNIANLGEETKDPHKTLPRGFVISIVLTAVLYVLVGLTAVSLVPPQELAASNAPLALAASAGLGPVAFDVLTAVALLTTFNTVLVLLITASRIIYGMGREGVLPRIIGKVSRNTNTPTMASLLTLFGAAIFLPLGKVDIIAEITSFGSLIAFAMINIALLNIRRIAPDVHRPFKAPLNIGWVSVTAVLGTTSCLLLLTQFSVSSAALGLALPLSGALIYVTTNHKK